MLLRSKSLIYTVYVVVHCSVLNILVSASEIKQTPLDSNESFGELSQNRNLINIFGTYPAVPDSNINNLRSEPENITDIEIEKFKISLDNMSNNPYYKQIDTRFIENESDIPEEHKSNLRLSELRADASDDLPLGNNNGVSRSVFISPKVNNVDTLEETKDNMSNYVDFVLLFDLYKRRLCASLMTLPKFWRCMEQIQTPYQLNRMFTEQVRNSENESKNEVENRNRYYSMEGKRNGQNIPKRIPFHSWGGKRVIQSSGGEKIQASRVPFNAWGGKRQYSDNKNVDKEIYEPCKRSKVKFHSWGGKRNEK